MTVRPCQDSADCLSVRINLLMAGVILTERRVAGENLAFVSS